MDAEEDLQQGLCVTNRKRLGLGKLRLKDYVVQLFWTIGVSRDKGSLVTQTKDLRSQEWKLNGEVESSDIDTRCAWSSAIHSQLSFA